MIILDTNVISEFMRPFPDQQVTTWANNVPTQLFYTTWINIAEINRGIAKLPQGKRKTDLQSNFTNFIQHVFEDRILSFEHIAAGHYGHLCALRENLGKHVDPIDLMIVAIAKRYKCKIATRNHRDFVDCGVEIINPWCD